MQNYFVTTKYLADFNKTLTYRYFDQKICVLRLRIRVLRLRVTNPTAFKNLLRLRVIKKGRPTSLPIITDFVYWLVNLLRLMIRIIE